MRNLLLVTIAAAIVFTGMNATHAGDYEITAKSAIIAPAKAGGADWDPFKGKPDPFVWAGIKLKAAPEPTVKGETVVAKDTLMPEWNAQLIEVSVGDEMIIKVWDKDLAQNDIIGEYKLEITKKLIEDGELKLTFGQVKELKLTIKAKAAPAK